MSFTSIVAVPVPPLFAACDGVRFYGPRDELFIIRAGVYPTGNGALVVMAENGEPECKITVNLVGYDLADDDLFHVKVDEIGRLESFILSCGFFEHAGNWVVRRYVDVWRFARCPTAAHQGGLVPDTLYAINCRACRSAHENYVHAKETQIKAMDTVTRLKGKPVST